MASRIYDHFLWNDSCEGSFCSLGRDKRKILYNAALLYIFTYFSAVLPFLVLCIVLHRYFEHINIMSQQPSFISLINASAGCGNHRI